MMFRTKGLTQVKFIKGNQKSSTLMVTDIQELIQLEVLRIYLACLHPLHLQKPILCACIHVGGPVLSLCCSRIRRSDGQSLGFFGIVIHF